MKRILISESEKRAILNQHKKAGHTISEQQESAVDVNSILKILKQNVQTPGTDEKQMLYAIGRLKSTQDIQTLENLISTSKGMRNLKSISDVINFELDLSDYQDTQTRRKIWLHLNNIDKSYRLQPDKKRGQKLVKVTPTDVNKKTPEKKLPPNNSNTIQWIQAPSESDIAQGKQMLKMGMEGDSVAKIQQELKLTPVDSKFGKNTYNAVVKFQKSKGLKPDGIVGKDTYRELMVGVTPDMEKAQAERIKGGQDSSAIQPPTA